MRLDRNFYHFCLPAVTQVPHSGRYVNQMKPSLMAGEKEIVIERRERISSGFEGKISHLLI